jgi:hypothetical protein
MRMLGLPKRPETENLENCIKSKSKQLEKEPKKLNRSEAKATKKCFQ